jgi:DNA-binding transcriptional ArsR family regulator
MPYRSVVSRELAELLGVLAHPHRLRIVEELRGRELDVGSLKGLLEVSHSGVSQHLALLRAHRLVAERREGRHVFYRLCQPELASWLLDGLTFLESDVASSQQLRRDVRRARADWSTAV